jgi:hypothetical protein
LSDSVADKLVQGENIAQTYQFVATANAGPKHKTEEKD